MCMAFALLAASSSSKILGESNNTQTYSNIYSLSNIPAYTVSNPSPKFIRTMTEDELNKLSDNSTIFLPLDEKLVIPLSVSLNGQSLIIAAPEISDETKLSASSDCFFNQNGQVDYITFEPKSVGQTRVIICYPNGRKKPLFITITESISENI